MSSIARLLEENLLEGEAQRVFDEGRVRVSRRHANWRANFPAVGALLDTDEERAQALAGNYATEARETVGVWLSAQEAAPSVPDDSDRQASWVEAYWSAWRARVFERSDVTALEGAARERFTRVFDELMVRFRDEAVGYVRDGGTMEERTQSLAARLAAPFRAMARAVEGFFFPSVRR
jgi:hypothetical protein